MLKRQEQAMTTVSRQVPRYDRNNILTKIVHHNGYAYVTDTFQAYRIPSGQPDSMPKTYPIDRIENLMNRTADKNYTAYPVNTEVVVEKKGAAMPFDLCKIGQNYFDLRKVKQAIRILGKNITCYETGVFRPLIFESSEGIGCLCPVRYIPD